MEFDDAYFPGIEDYTLGLILQSPFRPRQRNSRCPINILLSLLANHNTFIKWHWKSPWVAKTSNTLIICNGNGNKPINKKNNIIINCLLSPHAGHIRTLFLFVKRLHQTFGVQRQIQWWTPKQIS